MDTYDSHNPINPINQKELPERTELEEAQEYNWELKSKLKKAKKQVDFLIDAYSSSDNTLLINNLKRIRL